MTSAHQPGMVYVMLSRCCALDQLNILDKMNPDKIYVNADVEAEAKRKAEDKRQEEEVEVMTAATREAELIYAEVTRLDREAEAQKKLVEEEAAVVAAAAVAAEARDHDL